MTDPSRPLINARHEAFAVALAAANSVTEAYRQSGYAPGSAHKNASRLMANDGIKARFQWLQTQTASGSTVTKMEKRERLATIIRKGSNLESIAAIKVDNDLAGDGSEALANAALGTVAEAMVRIRSGKWRK